MRRRNALRGVLLCVWAAALVCFERKRALRPVNDSKLRRDARNLTIAVAAGATMQILEAPLAVHLAQQASTKRRGLLQRVPLPVVARTVVGIVLLDYTLYWWHY